MFKETIYTSETHSITCANLKIFFFLSMIFKVPFWKKAIKRKFKFALPIHQKNLQVILLLKLFIIVRERKKKGEGWWEDDFHTIKSFTFSIPVPFTVSECYVVRTLTSSHCPMSPVWSHPSLSSASSVLAWSL